MKKSSDGRSQHISNGSTEIYFHIFIKFFAKEALCSVFGGAAAFSVPACDLLDGSLSAFVAIARGFRYDSKP